LICLDLFKETEQSEHIMNIFLTVDKGPLGNIYA